MRNYDLESAKRMASNKAEEAFFYYLKFCKMHGIDWKDRDNQYVMTADELWNMDIVIDSCLTEDDINDVLGKITVLREQVLNHEQKLDLVRKECAATKKLTVQKLWKYYKMFDKYRKEKKEEGSQSGSIRSLLAKDLSVSTAQVSKLQNVDHNAIVSVKEAVANGDISLHTANEIAKLSKQQQEELAASGLSKVAPKDIEIHRGQ